MYQLVPAIFIFMGLALIIGLLARKLPEISSLDFLGEQESFPTMRSKDAPFLRWLSFRKERLFVLRLLARALQRFSLASLRFARWTEKAVHSLQGRYGRAAPVQFPSLPKLLSRLQHRRAYVEEERKLLAHLARVPDDLNAWKRLGKLYYAAENFSEAKRVFTEVLRLSPDDEEADARLLEIEEKMSRP